MAEPKGIIKKRKKWRENKKNGQQHVRLSTKLLDPYQPKYCQRCGSIHDRNSRCK